MTDPNTTAGDMLDFTIDINTEAKPFEAVPDGNYILTINNGDVRMKPGSATPSGFPALNITFTIVSPDEFRDRKVFGNFSMKPEAQGRLRTLIEAALGEWRKFNLSELVGIKVSAIIRQKPDNDGIPQNNIKAYSKIL
mgnify:CR=1 FL=1